VPYADAAKRAECARKACRRYYRRNHEEQLERVRRYRERRETEDPTFEVRRSIQTNFRVRLKALGVKKPPALEVMLGCKWSFFAEYLESQFGPEMSWATYGQTWEIHHLRSVSDFDFRRKKADVYLVNRWINLCVTPPEENRRRGEIVHLDDIRQLRANLEKTCRLGMVGRIPRKRTYRLNEWQMWLRPCLAAEHPF
jgi:hypothetical protein